MYIMYRLPLMGIPQLCISCIDYHPWEFSKPGLPASSYEGVLFPPSISKSASSTLTWKGSIV